MSDRQHGFTLVEVMIVVVIMAILAATVIPQFTNSVDQASDSTAMFNLNTLRSQIQAYKTQHKGKFPSNDLNELFKSTNASGTVGTGAAYPYGPYLQALPPNPFTNSTKVTVATADPPAAASGTPDAGWLYYPATGKLWLDKDTFLTK